MRTAWECAQGSRDTAHCAYKPKHLRRSSTMSLLSSQRLCGNLYRRGFFLGLQEGRMGLMR